MAFDPKKDYTNAIKEASERGDTKAVEQLNKERNEKIAASGGALDKYKNDVDQYVNKPSGGSSGNKGSKTPSNNTPDYSSIWNDNYQKAQDAIARGDSVAAAAALSLMQEADKSKNGRYTSTATYADLDSQISKLSNDTQKALDWSRNNSNKTIYKVGDYTYDMSDISDFSTEILNAIEEGREPEYLEALEKARNDKIAASNGALSGFVSKDEAGNNLHRMIENYTKQYNLDNPDLWRENPDISKQIGADASQYSPMNMQRLLGFADYNTWYNNLVDSALAKLGIVTGAQDRQTAELARAIASAAETQRRDEQIANANNTAAGGTAGARSNNIIKGLLGLSKNLSDTVQKGIDVNQTRIDEAAQGIADASLEAQKLAQDYGLSAGELATGENYNTALLIQSLVDRLNGIDQANAAKYYGTQSPTNSYDPTTPEGSEDIEASIRNMVNQLNRDLLNDSSGFLATKVGNGHVQLTEAGIQGLIDAVKAGAIGTYDASTGKQTFSYNDVYDWLQEQAGIGVFDNRNTSARDWFTTNFSRASTNPTLQEYINQNKINMSKIQKEIK